MRKIKKALYDIPPSAWVSANDQGYKNIYGYRYNNIIIVYDRKWDSYNLYVDCKFLTDSNFVEEYYLKIIEYRMKLNNDSGQN